MVGVLVSATKDGINYQPTPVHLQRLKSLFLFIGRLYTVMTLGVIIVQHHGIDAQLDNLWLFYVKSPDKKPLQQLAKQENACPGKGFEKSPYPAQRGHLRHIRFNTAGITGVVSKLIEIGQVPAGAVSHEAKILIHSSCGNLTNGWAGLSINSMGIHSAGIRFALMKMQTFKAVRQVLNEQ